jgi:hypothetical protein
MPLGAVLTRVQFPGLVFPALTVARSGDPLVVADNAHFPLRDSTDGLIPWVDVANPADATAPPIGVSLPQKFWQLVVGKGTVADPSVWIQGMCDFYLSEAVIQGACD